jgi:hypothetical protein
MINDRTREDDIRIILAITIYLKLKRKCGDKYIEEVVATLSRRKMNMRYKTLEIYTFKY